jgi:hypothetical protein
VVRNILGTGVPVNGTLCFVEADWPLIGGSFSTRGVGAVTAEAADSQRT